MQERGGGPAITMLSSATAISREVSSAMMEDGGAMLSSGTLSSSIAEDMATSMATSDHGGAASWEGGGAAWGCGGAAACAEPHPHPPGPSRISSRDLAQLDLAEIDLLSQV